MPADRRLIWAPSSLADLHDIWRYQAEAASPETADTVLRGIQDAALRLDRLATPGRPRDELLPGLRSVLVTPHVVFFRLTTNRIEVVRVFHQRRDIAGLLGTEP